MKRNPYRICKINGLRYHNNITIESENWQYELMIMEKIEIALEIKWNGKDWKKVSYKFASITNDETSLPPSMRFLCLLIL